jgi:hypothetical protein
VCGAPDEKLAFPARQAIVNRRGGPRAFHHELSPANEYEQRPCCESRRSPFLTRRNSAPRGNDSECRGCVDHGVAREKGGIPHSNRNSG